MVSNVLYNVSSTPRFIWILPLKLVRQWKLLDVTPRPLIIKLAVSE